MEIVSVLAGRWVEILAAVYLVGMMLYGHYRGFFRMAVSAASLAITLFSVHMAMPYVTDWLKNDTPVYGIICESVEHAVGLDELTVKTADGFGELAGKPAADSDEPAEQDRKPAPADRERNLQMPAMPGKAGERIAIESLDLPEQIKRLLIENNNSEVYRAMGVELFHDYITGYLADMIIRILVFVLLFFAMFVLLHVLVVWLDLLAKLPIISGLNQIAGAVLGAAEALIFIWIVCLICTVLSGTAFGKNIMAQIDASIWLSWIYDHNMLSLLTLGILQSVF